MANLPYPNPLSTSNRSQLTVVALAMRAGASDAESVIREGDEFSVNVRMGEVEPSGVRLPRAWPACLSRKELRLTSTSDFTADGIQQLVEGAMALAKVTEGDLSQTARDRRIRLAP